MRKTYIYIIYMFIYGIYIKYIYIYIPVALKEGSLASATYLSLLVRMFRNRKLCVYSSQFNSHFIVFISSFCTFMLALELFVSCQTQQLIHIRRHSQFLFDLAKNICAIF